MASREEITAMPDLHQFSDRPMFNTKAVVQKTGVPAPTLRAWERRYHLLSPERADNAYRLYSERDIAMIRWLKERVDEGMTISQAVALFRHIQAKQQAQDSSQLHEGLQRLPEEAFPGPPAFQVAIQPGAESSTGKTGEKERTEQPSVRDWPRLSEDLELSAGHYPAIHNMRMVRGKLIEAFNVLDEAKAHMLVASMLAIYPVELVCTELITPTLWRIGHLWAEGQLSVSVEHFASNFFRGLLTNLYHVTPGPTNGALALTCCAPGEAHELAALMLALFLRRSGVRVAYLGQSIETAGLIQTIQKLAPVLVCVSLTMPTYLPALIELGNLIDALPPPRPIFAFGGQVFVHYPNVIAQIPGIYQHGDLNIIVKQLLEMLQQRSEKKN
jgi:DNA-binding transcriptional MerR regulator/methanogenic corrinoid protein MtbC1